MKTILTTSPAEAASIVRDGGIVAFPTETVYGLGADALNPSAVDRIFQAKQRPPDNPLIVHVGDLSMLGKLADNVPISAATLVEKFFPGPLTVIVPRSPEVPDVVSAGLPTLAVRMPDHQLALAFLRECGTPVAAPSANRSGRPSPTNWQSVVADLDGRIDCVLQGTQTDHGLESTVVDCTVDPPIVLRTGALSVESLRDVIPQIRLENAPEELLARSPGTRHRHYAPDAKVVLIDGPDRIPPQSLNAAYIGLDAPDAEVKLADLLVARTVEQYAFELYRFLRQCDERGLEIVYCQTVREEGIGRAVMDRLRRASES